MNRTYRVLSYAFRVQSDVPLVAEPLDALLAPFRSESGERLPVYELARDDHHDAPYTVDLDGEPVQRAELPHHAVDYVLWHVNSEAIKGTRTHLALHAGAVGMNGRAVILPAPPNAGKTTLTAGLVHEGFEYLSDEAALIDPEDARVHPFHRAMWMEPPTVELLGRTALGLPAIEDGRYHYQVHAEDLRAGSAGGPCPVGFVVAPRYEAGGGTELVPMSRAEAIRMLAENSFNFGEFRARGLEILRRLVGGAECYRLRVGDLASAVEVVSRLVRRGSRPVSSLRRSRRTVAAR